MYTLKAQLVLIIQVLILPWEVMHEGYNMALCRIYYTKYVGKNFIPTYVYRSTHLVKKKWFPTTIVEKMHWDGGCRLQHCASLMLKLATSFQLSLLVQSSKSHHPRSPKLCPVPTWFDFVVPSEESPVVCLVILPWEMW